MDAVGAAFEAAGAMFQENPERVRLRDAIVSANAELRERELVKLAGNTIDYRSFPQMPHSMHDAQPKQFADLLIEFAAKLRR